jgi:hypothetical protein
MKVSSQICLQPSTQTNYKAPLDTVWVPPFSTSTYTHNFQHKMPCTTHLTHRHCLAQLTDTPGLNTHTHTHTHACRNTAVCRHHHITSSTTTGMTLLQIDQHPGHPPTFYGVQANTTHGHSSQTCQCPTHATQCTDIYGRLRKALHTQDLLMRSVPEPQTQSFCLLLFPHTMRTLDTALVKEVAS